MAAAPLLEVKGLSVELQRGSERRPVLGDVGFTVADRQVLGVIGESGSGKTTLAKAVVGWIQPPLVRTGGQVLFRGRDLFAMPDAERLALRGRHIGYIGADPGSSFDPTIPVGVQIAEKLRAVRPEIGQATRNSASSPCSTGSTSRRPRAATTSSRTSIRAACCSGR